MCPGLRTGTDYRCTVTFYHCWPDFRLLHGGIMLAGRLRSAATVLAAFLTVSACGGSDDSGSTDISPAQAQTVGQAAADQLGGLASGLTHFTTPGVGGLGAGFFAPQAPGGRIVSGTLSRLSPKVQSGLALIRADDCTPTQSDSTDTDHDGIPDDNIISFTLANCSSTDTTSEELVTISVTGSVRIQDGDDANTLFGYTVGITALTVTISDTVTGTPDLSVVVAGSFGADVQSTLAAANQNLRTSLRLNGTRVFGDHANWAVSYTPTGGTIDVGAGNLPAGDFTVNGSYDWVGDYAGATGDWSFSLQTPDPLAYDGSCEDQDWPFESGQLKGAISARRTVGFTIDYAGCGITGTITAYGLSAVRGI